MSEDSLRAIREAVCKRRELLGLTQEQAARQAGVSLASWRRAENDLHSSFRQSTTAKIERVLRLPRGGIELLRGGYPPDELEQVVFRPPSSKEWIWKFNESFRGDPITPWQAYVVSIDPGFVGADDSGWEEILQGRTTADQVHPFDSLPTWVLFMVNNVWLNQFRETYISVGRRIDQGHMPYPRCVAEEIALWIALEGAERLADDLETDDTEPREALDGYGSRDHDWEGLRDGLYQDTDFLELSWRGPQGIDAIARLPVTDPDSYHPFNWWKRFNNADAYDETVDGSENSEDDDDE